MSIEEKDMTWEKARLGMLDMIQKVIERKTWPQKPEVTRFTVTETYYHGGFLIRDSARPTCPEGAQLQLTINVSCYPAPTFTWTKDGQQIGKKVSGGTARQRGEEQVKEKSPESSASNQQHAVPAQEFQRRVHRTY